MRPELLLPLLAAAASVASAQHQDQPHHYNHGQRRWVWGPSIINDVPEGQPTPEGVPPIGVNVDLFASRTLTTPDNRPTMPSFAPPAAEAAPSPTPDAQANAVAPAPVPAPAVNRVPFAQLQAALAAAQSPAPAPTTTPTAAASPTAAAAAHPTFKNRQEVAAYWSSVSAARAAAAAAADTNRAKRHFAGAAPTAILQDSDADSAGEAPAMGGMWATTPDAGAQLPRPTFAGPPGVMPPGGIEGSEAMSRPSAPAADGEGEAPGMGGTWKTTPDAGTQLSRPTFAGPPGVMPSGGVSGSEAMGRPSSSAAAPPVTPSAVTPAQDAQAATIHAALQLNELNQAVSQLLRGLGLGGLLGLHKREEGAVGEPVVAEKREPRAPQLGKDHIRRVRRSGHGGEMRPLVERKRRVVDRE
ncbi:hypothetical protein JCM10449v2_001606 [Rhodotorula kratochvilovae]